MSQGAMSATRLVPPPLRTIRSWPVWSLHGWLRAFVLTVISADLIAIGMAVRATDFVPHDLALFGLLLLGSAAAVELTRRAPDKGGFMTDIQGVWELPVAILLPPFYALVVPIARVSMTQLRVRRGPVYRRVFTAASVGLSYGAASVVFHSLSGLIPRDSHGQLIRGAAWTLLVLLSALLKWILNNVMIVTAVKGSDPTANIRAAFLNREAIYNDIAEISAAILVTFAVAGFPLLALAALPVVGLLQRSHSHVKLVSDARNDAKTGLLNHATWERESSAELARAIRTESPLAIAMFDVDKFKVINDTYGHLVGDQVLKEIANTLNELLRDYDLAGRFGGEEFAVLLPQTRAVDALRIAERVRASVAALSIIAAGTNGGERVHVTVSVGVAALDSGSKRELSELIAAADAALYRAKDGGRDQVQMISTTRGLSAVSGPGPSTSDGDAEGEEAGSLFRRAQSS
jgi:diguanylate cyclase (GGDEF)-like protein